MNAAASTVTPIRSHIDARSQLRAVMDADVKITQALVARETSVSPSALNQWLGDKYAGDNEAVEAKVRTWLDRYEQRRASAATMPVAPGWTATPIAQRIMGTLSYAHAANDIAMIYGAAGVGKTETVKHYASTSLNVWIVTMKPSTTTLVPALRRICKVLGLAQQGGAADLCDEIVRRVAGTGGLLVIDEAQHLCNSTMDEIRSIHDETGIGIVFLGNEEMYKRMDGETHKARYLDRLRSRVGKKMPVRKVSEADINALIDAWGISDSKCRTKLAEIGRTNGYLRTLTKVLRLASMHALAEQQKVAFEHLARAWRELGGAPE